MTIITRFFLWFVFILIAGGSNCSATERRLALVIGVQSYQHLPTLRNTVADAELIGNKLTSVGFEVDKVLKDPSKDELSRAVRDFARKIEQAGEDTKALVYYAGHGVQDDSHVNYLLAADADAKSQIDLPTEGFSFDALLKILEKARPRIAFAILDACRDNPLPTTPSRGGGRGLAITEDQPVGVFIVFSTAPGRTAMDGPPGSHSPFAEAFAEILSTSIVEATPLFKLVANRVYEKTTAASAGEGQLPWTTGQYVGDFYFKLDPKASVSTETPAPPASASIASAPTAANVQDVGEIEFGRAVIANTVAAYENWIKDFSSHPRKPNAFALLIRLREEELWKRAKIAVSTEDRIGVLDQLINAYPDGVYAEKAKGLRGVLLTNLQPALVADTPKIVQEPLISNAFLERHDGMDAPGGDLGHWIENASEEQCERLCLSDQACVGFTYNRLRAVCIRKAAIRHLTAAADAAITVVVANRTAAPSIERREERDEASVGVQRYTGMDAPGDDRGAWLRNIANENRCRQICFSASSCVAYTYNIARRVCIPKTRLGQLTPSAEPAVTGVLTGRRGGAMAVQSRDPPAIRYHEGMDAPGYDIRPWRVGVSLSQCEQTCLSDANCAGLTYNRKRSTCILKDHIGALTRAKDPALTAVIGGRD